MSGNSPSTLASASRRPFRGRVPRVAVTVIAALGLLLSLGTAAHADIAVDGPMKAVMSRQSGGCLTVKDAKLWTHAADVRVEACRIGGHQQWRLEDLNNGFYRILVHHNTNMCLDVAHRGTTNGTNVLQGQCAQNTALPTSYNQQWRLTVVDGAYLLSPRHASGMCLEKDYWNDAVIYTCQPDKWWHHWLFL
jgi:hypothetical protein